ncbi:MAG: hypothetical protein U9N87_04785 [Planctomycetota bacterium]|nr:hypothetical protein [Planctomycetota bacterium]
MSGCDESERLARMARQSTERQAEQNREMAKLNRQVSENAGQLVEADREARQEMTQLQREIVERDAQCRGELNTLQQHLDRQRQGLEDERRDIAQRRHRDPIIATAITQIGLVLACLLPLLFCIYLLRALRNEEVSNQAVAELLVEELLVKESPLLGSQKSERPAISVERPPELPAAPEDDASDDATDLAPH